jgi:RNA polymerase sigma factor (TIGR02999 family)
METPRVPLTEWLDRWRDGQGEALAQVFEATYAELRRIAAQRLGAQAAGMTLSPTVLLHEAYLRVAERGVAFHDRAHFFAAMSLYIRSVLVDHARAREAAKRGGGAQRVTLDGREPGEDSGAADLLALHQSLEHLAAFDARCAEVLHLTCFAGLERQAIADLLGISLSSVDRDLRFAKAWVLGTGDDGR